MSEPASDPSTSDAPGDSATVIKGRDPHLSKSCGLSSEGAAPDYDLECAPSGRKDLVLTFTIEEPQALTVRAEGRSITYVELRTECGDGDTAEQCASGFPGTLRARSLEPGTYFVLVADVGGDLAIEVVFEDPRPAPPTHLDILLG